MIHFSLCCEHNHSFDGWFRSNEDYEKQRELGLITCPICGSPKVSKALMTPALAHSERQEHAHTHLSTKQQTRAFWQQWQEMARQLRKNADYVGEDFADKARKMHLGEEDPRSIYGEAKGEDIVSLLEDGIEIIPLPPLPEEQN